MVDAVFEGFEVRHVSVADGARLRVRTGGHGPAVVLLHGHPRTHTTWHRVAPLLVAAGLSVVCPDLRGYGRSTAPAPLPDHSQASKRVMAEDVVALMDQLGHDRFAVVGHDRGSYVAFRLAMDHSDHVSHLVVLDSVPIGEALTRAVVLAMIEDYRAGLGVDRIADDEDRDEGRRISCPTLVAWSTDDDMQLLYGDVLDVWRPWTTNEPTGRAIASGHHMAEQAPAELAEAIINHVYQHH